MRSTGVQKTTTSAWRTPAARSRKPSSMAPRLPGLVEGAGLPADPEHALGQAAPLGRQADGAADQADADDGEGVDFHQCPWVPLEPGATEGL